MLRVSLELAKINLKLYVSYITSNCFDFLYGSFNASLRLLIASQGISGNVDNQVYPLQLVPGRSDEASVNTGLDAVHEGVAELVEATVPQQQTRQGVAAY